MIEFESCELEMNQETFVPVLKLKGTVTMSLEFLTEFQTGMYAIQGATHDDIMAALGTEFYQSVLAAKEKFCNKKPE
jgi:hypothetical protein